MSKNSYNKKNDFIILLSNALDHFDTSIYVFIAPVIAKYFFPETDKVVALILSYGIYAGSSIIRPLGAIIFSNIVCKFGPGSTLKYTVFGVAISTFFIGCIPSYEILEHYSPILLTIVRIFQGIFAEGQNTIARLYILEHKIEYKALKASTFYQLSSIIGIIFASFVSMLLFRFNDSYWRLIFIFVGILGFIISFFKEFPNYNNNYKQDKITFLQFYNILLKKKVQMLSLVVIYAFSYMTYSLPFIIMNTFIPLITSVSLETMMFFNSIFLFIDAILFFIILRFIKFSNPINVMKTSVNVLMVSIIPLWFYLENSSLWYICLVRFWIVILGVIFACPMNICINNLLENKYKYFLSGLTDSLGSSIGRLFPAFCIALWYYTKISISIAVFVVIVAFITIYLLNAIDQNSNK